MAYRGIKGSDPFALKTTRNERFAQMSKQEQLIEQKKREIQAKLEEQKKKQNEEAMKKIQNSSSKPKLGRSLSSQFKSKKFWKTDQKWKKDNQTPTSKTSSVNIFSNDGSFLDSFRKFSGVKDTKIMKEDLKDEISTKDNRFEFIESGRQTVDDESEHIAIKREHLIEECNRENLDESCEQRTESVVPTWENILTVTKEEPVWVRHDVTILPTPVPPPRGSSPYSPTRETTPDSSVLKPLLPSLQQTHFQGSSAITIVVPPPPPPSLVAQPLPQPQFISYSTPPPTLHSASLHSIPPPAPIQPQSIPPPSPLLPQSIPPPPVGPPSLSIPPPGSLLSQSIATVPTPVPLLSQAISASQPQSSVLSQTISTPLPHLLQQPLPIIQTSIPPPTLIPLAGISSLSSHSVPPPVMPPMAAIVRSPNVLQQPLPVSAPLLPPGVPPPTQTPVPMPCHIISAGNGVCSTDTSAADEAREHLARTVAQCGDDIEDIIKLRNPDDPNTWFLHDKESITYKQYRQLVDKYRAEQEQEQKDSDDCEDSSKVTIDKKVETNICENSTVNVHQEKQILFKKQEFEEDENSRTSEGKHSGDDESDDTSRQRKKKRRSRWAPEDDKVPVVEVPAVVPSQQTGTPMLSQVTRTDPALIQYAINAFGTSNLSEEDWKKAEDHYKINLLYQDMMRKREELDRLARSGKFKYEYDSDEETDGGTWEHKLRTAEMEATQRWAEELTKKAEGKHHIGDFLPPDELERFLEKYNALKEGREPDLSDYKEFKLKQDNVGFQMLQKLGWTEGQGLGSDGSGIVEPVNKASSRPDNQGLGAERPADVSRGDDEYDAYRKRMMLAYRFRPNPLNNPRRPYY